MDFIKSLGSKAIATRFQRLGDKLHQDITQVCKTKNIDFDPSWFLVLTVIKEQKQCAVGELAKLLGVTHPTINHLSKEIIKRGYISSLQDKADKRRRLLSLTPAGEELMTVVVPLLHDIYAVADDVIEESGHDVLATVKAFETTIEHKSYYHRILEKMAQRDNKNKDKKT